MNTKTIWARPPILYPLVNAQILTVSRDGFPKEPAYSAIRKARGQESSRAPAKWEQVEARCTFHTLCPVCRCDQDMFWYQPQSLSTSPLPHILDHLLTSHIPTPPPIITPTNSFACSLLPISNPKAAQCWY